MKIKLLIILFCFLYSLSVFGQWTNINGTGNYFLSSGNVGIGTNNPTFNLHVNGNSNVTGQSWFSYGNNNIGAYSWTNAALTTNSIEIVNNNALTSNSSPTLAFHRWGSGGPQFRLAADGSNVFYLESSGAGSARSSLPYGGGPNSYLSRFHIDAQLTTTGSVGIGTTNPGAYKLAVRGSIIASSVTVQLMDSWPDYVFLPDYKKLPLPELEKYINQYKHLPGIPSAKSVMDNGLDIGLMNKQLLQQVEELTLHMIEKDKEIKGLQATNDKLEKKLINQEESLNKVLIYLKLQKSAVLK